MSNDVHAARVEPVVMPRGFVVELQTGCWLAEWRGDPGRTLKLENAKRYATEVDAIRAKALARRLREFPDATIYEA
jgi:hypothetical protein